MTDLIERIGPVVGIVAFLALAILAFLIFQQAREIRRLREWAGRAPERADEALEASTAAAEARGEELPEDPGEEEVDSPSRLATWWRGIREERLAPAWAAVDRRSPVDPRYFLAVILAGIVAAGVLTSGFGLIGGTDDPPAGETDVGGGGQKEEKVEVAVLNATQVEDSTGQEIQGVPGLAKDVAQAIVKPAGFNPGEKTDATSGFPESVVMFEDGEEESAQALADAIAAQLGETLVQPIVAEVADLAGGAPVVLVVGLDDADVLDRPSG